MKIKKIVSQNIVLIIAWLLAIISIFFVKPDRQYLSYFDYKTLVCLFLMMLILGGYKNINIFSIAASFLIKKLKNIRLLFAGIVFITFFSSIFIANDMALLTFLPLTILVFKQCGKEDYIAVTIIMQNIAANLGGMIMPFGNPQSLYLFNFYKMSVGDFVITMLLPFLVSLILIALFSFTVKKQPVELIINERHSLSTKKTVVYSLLFILAIVTVFDIVPYLIALAVIITAMFFTDKKSFKEVDYGLLFTFVAFFIFASNMSRLSAVERLLAFLLNKSTLLTGVLFCQVFSNVPTAILLSQFTDNYRELLLAVNIGGTGTIIASLASLISFRIYSAMYEKKALTYLAKFLLINFAFLAVLIIVSYINLILIL